MDRRRFMLVNTESYFQGNKAFGGFESKYNAMINVLDLEDFVMQRVSVGDIVELPKGLFFNYPDNGYGGNYSILFKSLDGVSCVAQNEIIRSYLGINGISRKVEVIGSKVFIDEQPCYLQQFCDDLRALDGEKWHTILSVASDSLSIRDTIALAVSGSLSLRLLFAYRVQNSLITCYQVKRGNNITSVSLCYDLLTAEFQGYYVYGSHWGMRQSSDDLVLKVLSKEILRG